MSHSLDRALSSLSLSPSEDDWDSTLLDAEPQPESESVHTPRNSVVFPAEDTPSKRSRYSSSHSKNSSMDNSTGKKRTISELLRLHSEKGSGGRFSAEEALRIADVLGQWINASSSPYEAEDDFFAPVHAQDDMSVAAKRPVQVQMQMAMRPRGRSESATSPSASNSRPPSSAGFVASSS